MACSKVFALLVVCFSFCVWAQIPNCYYQGYVCTSTCQTLYFCVGANQKATKIEDCTGDDLCNSINGNCTADEGLTCFAEHPFECKSAGIFPDLYNCSVYYNCTGSSSLFNKQKMECSKTAYDVTTKKCDLTTSSPECNRNGRISGCTKSGDSGVVKGDKSLYYVCIRDPFYLYLYPQLYKCPGSETYDPNTFTCS